MSAFLLTQLIGYSFNVTFQVDMNNVTQGFTTPEVNGTMNGWCGGCAAMTDANGDNIWEITIALGAGTYEYKFAADSWAIQESLVPGSSCTLTTGAFTNRLLVVSGDVVLDPVCWGACAACGSVSGPYNVTFQVDMTNVTEAYTTPEVNGLFNNWCGGCAPMSDANGDNIWDITISLQPGTYEYKFAADSWTIQENLTPGSPCTITTGAFTNRTITVSEDITLDPVCWAACNACNVAVASYDVTFRVDMNGVTDMFTTPEVNGTFNNWCGGCAPMSDVDGDGIWELTITLDEGNYEYKFAYDSWAGSEQMTEGDPCTVGTAPFVNRSLSVTADATLAPVCWASCNACGVVVLDQMDLPCTFEDEGVEYGVIGFEGAENSTIVVDPTDANNTVVQVVKSATAQPWAGTTVTAPAELGFATAIPFTETETTMSVRVWSPQSNIAVRLKVEDHMDPTHSVETDAFTTVAGEWETLVFDFANQGSGTAALNLAYTFDKASIFFNYGVNGATAGEQTYYFDDIEFGGDVIVQPTTYNVTFRVDMNNVTSAFTTPEVNGTFNNWCGGCAPMSDVDGDNVWELVIPLEAGSYEFKYAADSWAISEQLADGQDCVVNNGGFINRVLNVSADTDLGTVCWASCAACGGGTGTAVNVTFQVNMADVTDAFTAPEVNGTFNNWCGGCAAMTDANGDNIWEITIPLEPGTYEYKYAADTWTIQENLPVGSSCTITTGAFTNRLLVVSANETLPVVCWGSCEDCGQSTGPFNVTFKVDMSLVTATYTTPEVNGTFNNWCGGCAPMSDVDGDDVWELTISLPVGTHEYKFAYDSWAGQEELTPGTPCVVTVDGFTNRTITVSETAVLDAVCWASCEACIISVDELTGSTFGMYPNPAGDNITMNFEGLSFKPTEVKITNAIGQTVHFETLLNANQKTISTERFENGVYFVVLSSGEFTTTQKFIVQH